MDSTSRAARAVTRGSSSATRAPTEVGSDGAPNNWGSRHGQGTNDNGHERKITEESSVIDRDGLGAANLVHPRLLVALGADTVREIGRACHAKVPG